ncbi:hypothetical protein LINPERPRIM_LOCUS6444 [Linum perenne]
MMVNALRRIIIAKNGRLNSPIKHLDWHPDYMCLNLFYIPMGLYNNLPASVYLLLVYMSRVNTIGMILNKTKLRLCFQSWDIFPGTSVLESLTNSLNYTSDGRIKENIGIIPITRLERDYFYEAVHSRQVKGRYPFPQDSGGAAVLWGIVNLDGRDTEWEVYFGTGFCDATHKNLVR